MTFALSSADFSSVFPTVTSSEELISWAGMFVEEQELTEKANNRIK
jgi:hypothetical protein